MNRVLGNRKACRWLECIDVIGSAFVFLFFMLSFCSDCFTSGLNGNRYRYRDEIGFGFPFLFLWFTGLDI